MDAWWHEVWQTLQAEFADIGDARQLTQMTVALPAHGVPLHMCLGRLLQGLE